MSKESRVHPNTTSVRIADGVHSLAKRMADEFRTNISDIVEVGVQALADMSDDQKMQALRRQPARRRREPQPA